MNTLIQAAREIRESYERTTAIAHYATIEEAVKMACVKHAHVYLAPVEELIQRRKRHTGCGDWHQVAAKMAPVIVAMRSLEYYKLGQAVREVDGWLRTHNAIPGVERDRIRYRLQAVAELLPVVAITTIDHDEYDWEEGLNWGMPKHG